MEKNSFFKLHTIVLVIIIVGLMGAVRYFESTLFYDPFLKYFKSDYQDFPLPGFDSLKLVLGFFSRYFINSLLSLALVFVVFKDWCHVRFSAFLLLLFFFVLLGGFFLMVYYFEDGKMVLFYIRRFIIQPIFILLFLPGFYFLSKRNSNGYSDPH
jgi:exosortase F-associated protein